MSSFFVNVAKQFPESEEYVVRGLCPCCAHKALFFKDHQSYQEFLKTGYCQDCQDEKYGCYDGKN